MPVNVFGVKADLEMKSSGEYLRDAWDEAKKETENAVNKFVQAFNRERMKCPAKHRPPPKKAQDIYDPARRIFFILASGIATQLSEEGDPSGEGHLTLVSLAIEIIMFILSFFGMPDCEADKGKGEREKDKKERLKYAKKKGKEHRHAYHVALHATWEGQTDKTVVSIIEESVDIEGGFIDLYNILGSKYVRGEITQKEFDRDAAALTAAAIKQMESMAKGIIADAEADELISGIFGISSSEEQHKQHKGESQIVQAVDAVLQSTGSTIKGAFGAVASVGPRIANALGVSEDEE